MELVVLYEVRGWLLSDCSIWSRGEREALQIQLPLLVFCVLNGSCSRVICGEGLKMLYIIMSTIILYQNQEWLFSNFIFTTLR